MSISGVFSMVLKSSPTYCNLLPPLQWCYHRASGCFGQNESARRRSRHSTVLCDAPENPHGTWSKWGYTANYNWGYTCVIHINNNIIYIYIYYIIMIRYAVYISITMPNQDLDPEEQHLHPFPVRDPFWVEHCEGQATYGRRNVPLIFEPSFPKISGSLLVVQKG